MYQIMQDKRDLSFDAFRGIAIIAVVAAHGLGTVYPSDNSIIGKWNFNFLLVYVQALLFCVPVLFFMSGYWSSKRPIKSLHDYGFFLKRKLSRVLLPYLFWSLILLGCTAVKAQKINPYHIVFAILTGKASYPYYFIIAIVQLYLITPLINYINHRKYGLMLILALTVIIISAIYLSRVFGIIWHLPIYLPFYSWVIYYEIGLLAGSEHKLAVFPKGMHLFIIPTIFISLLLSVIEAVALVFKSDNLSFAIAPVKYSTLSYSVCIIIAFLLLKERIRHWPKFMVISGKYSFGIYLIHLPILTWIAGLVRNYKVIYMIQPLYQVIITVLTLSACLVIIEITRKLLPNSFCVKVLGFGVPPTSYRTDRVHQARPNIEKSLKSTTPSG
jgi:surface polysaccharide O-acyltransferase-like enzyme